MPNEVCTQGAIKRNRYERNYGNGQNGMGKQDGEVDWSNQALSGKPRRPVLIMIGNVGSEKNNRDDYC